jgi:hypothetical protein
VKERLWCTGLLPLENEDDDDSVLEAAAAAPCGIDLVKVELLAVEDCAKTSRNKRLRDVILRCRSN